MTGDKTTWRRAKLGDFFRIKHGYAFKGEFFSEDGDYIVLTPGNFQPDGGLKLKGEKEKFYIGPVPDEFLLRRGELLVVMTDLTQNAPILGSPAFVPEDGRYLHNQRLGKVVDLHEAELDPLFLSYLFSVPGVRSQIKASATGATVKHTAPERIYAVEFYLPPVPVQQEIASILSAYDLLIENNIRRIRILEEMARITYLEWCVNYRFPGSEQSGNNEANGFSVPEGWEPKKLGDIAEEIRRTVHPDQLDGQTPYVGLEHLPRRSIALAEWGSAVEVHSTKLVFRRGDILFGKIRPYFHKVAVAPIDGIASSDAIVIAPRSPGYFPLVLSTVASDAFVAHATQTSQGTKMPRANWSVLANYPVAVPQPDLLKRFNEMVGALVTQIQNSVFRVRNLRRARNLLLPRLVTGDIDVEDLQPGTIEAS